MAKTKAQRRAEKQQKRAINMLNKLVKRGYINAEDYIIEPADVSADKGTPITQGKSSKIRHKGSTRKALSQNPAYRQSKLSRRALNRTAKSNKNDYKMFGKLAKSVLDDGEITADEVIDIIDVDSEPIEQETEDFVPIQDQHVTDTPAMFDVVDKIRQQLHALERGDDVYPKMDISTKKDNAIDIFEDTVTFFEDRMEDLVEYLYDNEYKIASKLHTIAYESGQDAPQKVDMAFAELFMILNMGAFTPAQSLAVNDFGEYYNY